MKRFIFPFFLLALLATSCFEKHFIHDKDERHQVHQDFLEREKMVGDRHTALFSVFDGDITKEEREALEFLYAYMPLSDLADYDGNFYLNQVRNSLEARNFFSWGNSVPEDVFRHFVLPYRVNNENLDSARTVFFHELKDRIKEMSMYDAALEVNHWCHEKVTYRPSDSRTSSPLSTVKNALGRCGEESTFTVTALRSVGIPARQCYTPRWAHTDDNHAWVEVWVNGKWYFLGACEPDPELNMGWFAIPSTRTMMVHSNAFGKYKGEEEVNYQTPLFSRVNMLPHYTDTEKIKITILDEANKPVPGAEVKFKLYNYAEYYPIASKKSDTAGIAQLTTGKGDLLIWASKGTKYGYKKIDVRAQDELTIILNKEEGKEYVELLEMCPPAELHNQQKVKQAEIERHHKRLQYEDSLRNAYMATFMTDKQADLIVNENLTKEQVRYFIKKSEGNYAEIKDFLMTNPDRKKGIYLYDFLNSLSEKDVRDVSAATLQSHITFFNPEEYPFEVYLKGIISPRISNEGLRMWRSFLKEKMNKELKSETSCQKLIDWITRNIVIDDEANYFNCPVSPQGVYELKLADHHSRDIFFVAACRALDIPAYMDAATGQLLVYEKGEWHTVTFEAEKKKSETGTLILEYKQKSEIKPEYWTHYTIAKFEEGDFVTFDYENDSRVKKFPVVLELEAGYYMISTGIRYSDGTTLSRLDFFNLPANQAVKKEMVIRKLEPRKEFYGTIDLNYKIPMNHRDVKLADLVEDRKMVVCFIDPTREPTKHLLKEIGQLKNQFEKWGGRMVFAVPTEKIAPDFNFSTWNLPQQAFYMEDKNGAWFNQIMTSTDQYFRDNYPVVFIVNKEGDLEFKTEGYRIGTGELIFKSLMEP